MPRRDGEEEEEEDSPLLAAATLGNGSMNRKSEEGDPLALRKWLNTALMGSGFLLLFAGYNTAQSFAATATLQAKLGKQLGLQMLSVLYVSCVITLPFCPVIVRQLGPRLGQVVGGLLYVFFVASLALLPSSEGSGDSSSSVSGLKLSSGVLYALLYVSSALTGVGAAVLWTAQGQFLTRCCSSAAGVAGDRGLKAAVFWGVFQVSGLLGNGAATLLLDEFRVGFRSLFLILGCFSVAGVLLLALLRRLPEGTTDTASLARVEDGHVQEKQQEEDQQSGDSGWLDERDDDSLRGERFGNNVVEVDRLRQEGNGAAANSKPLGPGALTLACLRLQLDRRILFLTPMFFFTGFELSYATGSFPLLLGASRVGPSNLAFAVGEIAASLVVGKLSDAIPHRGRTAVIALGVMLFGAALVLSWFIAQTPYGDSPTHFLTMMFVAAAFLGMADCSVNTMVYAALATLFDPARAIGGTSTTTAVFTLFQIWQNIGSAVGFYYQPHVALEVQIAVVGAVAVVAGATYAFLKL